MPVSLLQLNISVFNGGAQSLATTIESSNSNAPIREDSAYAFTTGDNPMPVAGASVVISNITGTLRLYSSGNPALTTGANVFYVVPNTGLVINASAGATASLVWI